METQFMLSTFTVTLPKVDNTKSPRFIEFVTELYTQEDEELEVVMTL